MNQDFLPFSYFTFVFIFIMDNNHIKMAFNLKLEFVHYSKGLCKNCTSKKSFLNTRK